MTKNETSSTGSMSTTTSVNDKRSNAFQKAQRYLGIFVVLSLAYLLFSPRSNGGLLSWQDNNPRPYAMNKNYYEKTILSDLVILFNQGHAFEIQYAGRLIETCKKAKNSAVYLTTEELQANFARLKDAQKEKEAQSILDGCTPTIDWNSTHEARATEIEPTYRDLVRRLYELIQKAREEQGLDNNRQPRPTPEMLTIYERLEEIRKPLALASLKWLVTINGIVHIVVMVLIGLGLRSRELVGRMFLAPFAWVFSGIKAMHSKV